MRREILARGILVLTGVAATLAATAGTHYKPQESHRDDGVEIRRGAVWVSDIASPSFVFATLGEQPAIPPWQPGDPIREVPRQFYGSSDRPVQKPVNPTSPWDDLAGLQAVVGRVHAPATFNSPLVNVAGLGNTGVQPPDPAGDIGTTHYIQSVNGSGGAVYQIFTKTGSPVGGVFSMEVLAAGGACASGYGDPVVVFDELANRWLLTEFSTTAGRSLCIYISQLADPSVAQTWTRYVVQAPSFPDYPKYGVWPDAYYVGTNESAAGVEVYALDRVKMLAGQPIATQRFVAPELPGFGFQVLQPIDLDGAALPPAGAPGTLIRHRDDESHDPTANDPARDKLELFELDVDWTTPANSTLAGPITVPVSEFSSNINGLSAYNAFPQPSGQKLDPLREQVMFRPAYRSYGSFEQIVGNLTTDIDGADTGGVRWFELRRTGGASQPWQLYQEGTVALGDFVDRWMAGIAVDQDGNIGLAYSAVRGSGNHPAPNDTGVSAGLRYIGRLDGDPVDVMTSGETLAVAGSGSQSGERWGDYHAMSVDPADGCSFWFTGEYVDNGNWTTRIFGARHDRCSSPQFMLNSADVRIDVCAATLPQSALIDLDVLARNGFFGNVSLQFGALPAGVGGAFVPAEVAAPSVSVGTLTLGAGVEAGSYLVPVLGSSGALSKEFDVRLNIAVGAVQLLAPGDGVTAQSITPTFTWNANGDTSQYLLQVATDNAFANIVYSSTTGTTSHVLATSLAYGTQYFWRVQSLNGTCGAGAWSPVRAFTTMNDPAQCPVGTTATILFDDAIEPAQAGWVAAEIPATGAPGWAVTTTRPASPTRAWEGDDSATSTEQRLDTPSITIPASATSVIVSFLHAFDLEERGTTECWDGAALDLSTNNGSSYAAVADTSIIVGGYARTIRAGTDGNVLSGRGAWCATSLTHSQVVADLGAIGGTTAKLRFRLATDSSQSVNGWYVDDLVVKACMPVAASTTTLTSSNDPSVFGQSTTLTATVSGGSGTPTGNVEFRDGATVLGTSALTGGVATLATSVLSVTTHSLSAVYPGNATYGGSTGLDSHVVNKSNTQLGIVDSPDPSTQGANVTVTAMLAAQSPGAGVPTGNIAVTASNSSGCSITVPAQTACTLTFTAGGAQTIQASYSGDGNFNASTSASIDHQSNAVPNTAPSINAEASAAATLEDAATAALGLTLADAESPDELTLTATASTDPVLVPLANVAFTGAGLARTVAFTPAADRAGSATVTITVTDSGGLTDSVDVLVTVNPVNDAPSFTTLGDLAHSGGASGAQSVPGFVIGVNFGANETGQTVQNYTIGEVGSSGVINAVSLASDGTLDYTLTGVSGAATIRVTLTDDGGTANGGLDTSTAQEFTISVDELPDDVFDDGFESQP